MHVLVLIRVPLSQDAEQAPQFPQLAQPVKLKNCVNDVTNISNATAIQAIKSCAILCKILFQQKMYQDFLTAYCITKNEVNPLLKLSS